MKSESTTSMGRNERIIAVVAWVGFAVVLAILAFSRAYPGMRTETDLLGPFLRDALQFQRGEALGVEFQPPLYPALLALGHLIYPDWFRVGLGISWLSMVASVGIGFAFFRKLYGPASAWGAAGALAVSATAIAFGAQATSDAPFLFLYTGTLLLALLALRSPRPGVLFLLLGMGISATLLFRFNGLPLLALALVVVLREEPVGVRISYGALLLLGAVMLMGVWLAYATATGSPLYPTENYLNLAMTYFGEGDRISIESRVGVAAQFSSTLDVLLHDPVALGTQYLRDLIYLPQRLLQTGQTRFLTDGLMAFPIGLLALPGVVLLFLRNTDRFSLLFLVISVGHVLLLNLKTYDPRFFLFVVPILGAGAGYLLQESSRLSLRRWQRAVGAAILLLLAIIGARASLLDARRALRADQIELSEAITGASGIVRADDVVVARKMHVPFYSGAGFELFPEVDSVEDLARELRGLCPQGEIYVYFGQYEEGHRGALAGLRVGDVGDSPFFEPVLRGEAAEWTLYRFNRTEGDSSPPPSRRECFSAARTAWSTSR
ncbi:MAG: glycosyltransferase family 39 protein [Gemmatimonadota bacterium]